MKKHIKRIFHIAYDIFPVLNRPMALCAVLCLISVFIIYKHTDASLSLLVLLFIAASVICFLTKNRKIVIISVLLLAVAASTVNELYTIRDLEMLDGQTVTLDLVAIEDSESSGKVSRVTVYSSKNSSIPANTKLILYYYTNDKFICGDKFNATVALSKINNEYKLSNLGKGVYISSKLISRNENYKPNGFFKLIGNVRHYISDTIKKRFAGDISATLLAINAGNREYLSDDFYGRVVASGVSHVMVVSGLHLSIILGLFFKYLEKVFYSRTLKAIVSVAAILFICALFGFTQSILRAGAMFVFAAVAPLFMRKNDMLNSLGGAVIFMLYLSPFCIFSVAFELSVLSTAAVVWIAPFYIALIKEKLFISGKIGGMITEIFVVSISAMIFTAPVTISVFGHISLLAPVAFLLITFPVTWALAFNTAGLFINAVPIVSFLSVPFYIVSGVSTKFINFIINNLGQLDFLYVSVHVTEFIASLFLIFIVISAMYIYKYYQKLLKRRYITEVNNNVGNKRKRA